MIEKSLSEIRKYNYSWRPEFMNYLFNNISRDTGQCKFYLCDDAYVRLNYTQIQNLSHTFVKEFFKKTRVSHFHKNTLKWEV